MNRVGRWSWVLILVIPVAYAVGRLESAPRTGSEPLSERGAYRDGRLTSPFLEPVGVEGDDPSLLRVRAAVAGYIAEVEDGDSTLRVSVYVRDLDGGAWIGIDERERFSPASLTKVAILVYTLHQAETAPGLLDTVVEFPGADAMLGDDSMGGAPDSLRMKAGEAYSRRELLRRMIEYSDNHASQLLMEGESGERISRMLYNLSAEQSYEDGEYYFDARTVASLLRVLYNSSFLSRPDSEFALELLSRSFMQDGLRRLLPEEVTVASKFGFHASVTSKGPHHEFHECGIIYRPGSPYVICVMTATDKGSPEGLDRIVGEVSRIVWAQ